MLAVEEITTAGSLRSLHAEWSALYDRCGNVTPFQSPEWLLPWWDHFGGVGLWTLALREADRLVGLAPMFIYNRPAPPVRQLTLLGTGLSDYLDILVDPGAAAEGVEKLLEYLVARRAVWDCCDFEDLREESPFWSARVPRELMTRTVPGEVCPVAQLPPTPEEFIARLSPGLRRNLRRYGERLASCGSFETADESSLDEYLDALFRLHRDEWQRRNRPGVLAAEGVEAFHRAAAPGLYRRGLLRLHGLRFRGALEAIMYTMFARRRCYCYLSGFAPQLARFSPGALLIGFAIREAIRSGAEQFDFLRGGESYKYMWGARDRRNRRWLAWHSPQFAPADARGGAER